MKKVYSTLKLSQPFALDYLHPLFLMQFSKSKIFLIATRPAQVLANKVASLCNPISKFPFSCKLFPFFGKRSDKQTDKYLNRNSEKFPGPSHGGWWREKSRKISHQVPVGACITRPSLYPVREDFSNFVFHRTSSSGIFR